MKKCHCDDIILINTGLIGGDCMLYRTVSDKIDQWLSNSSNALLVTGARQVGKTWLIRDRLRAQKQDYIEINLIDNPEYIDIIDQCRSVQDLVIGLSAVSNHIFKKNETIIFIDEVQEYKDIVTRIKFWVDEGSYRYILSGSLLGVELRNLRSAPVGYLTEIKMYPLDFNEFLIASGVTDDVIQYLHTCYDEKKPVMESVHKAMLKHFKRYLVVGGMPDAVQEYVNTSNISTVSDIQRNIIELYKRDFTKYESIDKKLKLVEIYNQIPAQLMKQNRRFNYSDIKKGLRFERLEDSFLWLTYAGVSIPVYNTTEPRVALKQNTKSTLLKIYSSDVGLLTCQYGNSIRAKILTDDITVNLGGIYENAIAQELNTFDISLYFYNSHKNGELDFLIEQEMSVVPIEVKSGKDYTIHSAMSKAVNNPEYQIKQGYVMSNANIDIKDKITYLPVYMISFIKQEKDIGVLEDITM